MDKRLRLFALRDTIILVVTMALWLMPGDATWWHVITGSLTGLCALLLHEWGHLYGAHRSRAIVYAAPGLWSPFLFDLDSSANSPSQFVTTSLWGFYATGLYLCGFLLLLPLDQLVGRIALGIGLFLTTLTFVIEFPIAWRVHRGYAIPRVEIFRRRTGQPNKHS